MRIFVEGNSLFAKTPSGIGQYTKRLVVAMADLLGDNDSITIYGFMPLRPSTRRQAKNIKHPKISYRFIILPAIAYNFFQKVLHVRLPVDVLMLRRPEVIVFPNYFVQPTLLRVKKYSFIHDVSYKFFPESISPRNLKYLEEYIPHTIAESSRILTISESSKRDIVRELGVPANKIDIIPPAIDPRHFYRRPKSEVAKLLSKYKLPPDYILFVSTLEPRKNVVGILQAFETLPKTLQAKHSLVLVGGKGWRDEGIMAELERLKDLPIIRPGYVSDEDLPALYTASSLFVFPSHYEGFGIPPLEAMACGVPVITANNSSLPEVVGDAAVLIDADNTAELSRQMARVLTDKKLSSELSSTGLNQSKKFSWDKSAQELLRVLKLP
jgi:glycosyltransferase involved in cell wall biosynthesis